MRERLPSLNVRAMEHRESGSKRGRKLWVVARETVIQVLDVGAFVARDNDP
jgi:hypothetical protein